MPFPSVMNFRDLGGKPAAGGRRVKSGLLFRTGALAHATAADAQALAARFGLTHYCDFRTTPEITRDGEPTTMVAAGVAWVRLPFDTHDEVFAAVAHPRARDWAALYLRLAERRAGVLAALFERLADATGPTAYGCAVGKDRTGIATALLYQILGVPDDLIAADYLATSASLVAHHERFAAIWTGTDRRREDVIQDWFTCHDGTMEEFLADVAARGGAAGLLGSAGLDPAVLTRLRSRYLDDSGA